MRMAVDRQLEVVGRDQRVVARRLGMGIGGLVAWGMLGEGKQLELDMELGLVGGLVGGDRSGRGDLGSVIVGLLVLM